MRKWILKYLILDDFSEKNQLGLISFRVAVHVLLLFFSYITIAFSYCITQNIVETLVLSWIFVISAAFVGMGSRKEIEEISKEISSQLDTPEFNQNRTIGKDCLPLNGVVLSIFIMVVRFVSEFIIKAKKAESPDLFNGINVDLFLVLSNYAIVLLVFCIIIAFVYPNYIYHSLLKGDGKNDKKKDGSMMGISEPYNASIPSSEKEEKSSEVKKCDATYGLTSLSALFVILGILIIFNKNEGILINLFSFVLDNIFACLAILIGCALAIYCLARCYKFH